MNEDLGSDQYNKKSDPENTVQKITVLYALITIYSWYNMVDWELSSLVNINLIILPVTVLMLWRKWKIGWILFSSFLMYLAITELWTLILYLNLGSFGTSYIDKNYPQTSAPLLITFTLFYSATLWYLLKVDLRKLFGIDNRMAVVTLVVASILTILFNLTFFQSFE
ncbi:hypothetical protein SAMN05661096_02860 [Marivirga sericea]|uniref:Uncharacterized protein n=1 Tax=Marivirga sericea TaxID=1028 RepID=A0A1X7KLR3_9BACT|nr:hypothetical protein [Marivirga sericea]SMG42070.1 hypothetical protein SAMN05661096_02860 [Marivirga sericea]